MQFTNVKCLDATPLSAPDIANLQVSLQYFGTFSWELNRPSWKPYKPAGSIIDYVTLANTPTPETSMAINRDLTAVRDSSGSQLVKTRFAFSRIDELLNTGNPSIQADFGLKWKIDHWDYVGPAGSAAQTAIKRLDEVASDTPARQPNFFEVLKTVVLSGSTGLGSGATFVAAEAKYTSTDYQIMQIGANIIDSWDADNVPTFINFGGNVLPGAENLPYLNKLVFCPNFPPNTGSNFDAWLVPSLWNPHQNAPGSGVIRILLTGSIPYTAAGVGKNGNQTITTQSTPISPIPATMDVDASGFGTVPSPPMTILGSTSSVTNIGSPENFYGFHYPFSDSNVNQVTQQNADSAYPDFGNVVGTGSVLLQIQNPVTSTFIPYPYQTWNIATPTGHPLLLQSAKNNFANGNKLQDPEFVSLDPRTVRFGIWGSAGAGATSGGNTKKDLNQGAKDSLDQQAPANRLEQVTLYQPQGSSFTVGNLADLSWYSANNQSGTYYKDLDGVQRYADFTTNDGITKGNTIMYPLTPGLNDRSRISNAPFQSIAELGQVFRDQPWKTLNFTSASAGATSVSADAGLLDAFSLQDSSVVAGRTFLNTRQTAVLTAILSQAAKKLNATLSTDLLTPAQVTNIVTALRNLTLTPPAGQAMLINKAELVTRLAADSSVTGLGNKEARECVLRAFSDACQTRTWNLMIDVIAQSGRYPASAANVSQFVVEGEKRYWLHVAIDRFTGEVIDQQLEAVYE